MKRFGIFFICFLLCVCSCFTAFAGGEEKETAVDSSQPRLMVTSYKVDNGSISPSKKAKVKITLKNYSQTKAVKNIKLSLTEESGDIKPDGMGTQYISSIGAGGEYVWELTLIAAKTAQIGEHAITVSAEYEDKTYAVYSSSDIIRVTVKQSVSLDYDGVQLPAKVVQDDTQTVDITLMNTGKSTLRNCKIDFDIEGLDSGGCTFVGEIPAGESKTGSSNLRVSPSKLGEVKGVVTISYEDEFGKKYSKSVDVSTKIEKKAIKTDSEETEDKSKYPFWWLFLLIGLAAGGGIGCAIPISINSRKQRMEDEKRL